MSLTKNIKDKTCEDLNIKVLRLFGISIFKSSITQHLAFSCKDLLHPHVTNSCLSPYFTFEAGLFPWIIHILNMWHLVIFAP